MTPEEFLDIKEHFQKEVDKINSFENSLINYPRVKLNTCIADSISGYVIDPYGKLTKCWCDIGHDEYCVGNITNNEVKFNRLIEYFNYDVFTDPKCQTCSIIPICLGGCPRRRIDKMYSICETTKNIICKNITFMAKSKDPTLKSLVYCNF